MAQNGIDEYQSGCSLWVQPPLAQGPLRRSWGIATAHDVLKLATNLAKINEVCAVGLKAMTGRSRPPYPLLDILNQNCGGELVEHP